MIEDRVRESLRDRADRVETSSGAWDGILRGLERGRRRTRLRRAGIAAGILALFAGALTWTWAAFSPGTGTRPADAPATLVPVDPHVVDVIDVGRFPAGIAAGGGSAWVSVAGTGDCNGEIVRLMVRGGETVETARIPVDGWPGDLAVGSDAVWTEGFRCGDGGGDQGGVFRIDPATRGIVGFIHTGGRGVLSDVALGEEAVWVTSTEEGSVGEVVKIDPRTNSIQGRIPIAGSPRDIVVAEGSVWVLTIVSPEDETLSGLEVLRIDPVAQEVVGRIPHALGLGVGEGALWLPTWLTENEIALKILDPRTLEIREVIEGEFGGFSGEHGTLGSFPVAEGGAWLFHRARAQETADLVRALPNGRVDAAVSPSGTDWGIDAALDPTTDTLWLARLEDSVVRVELR